MEDKIKKNLDIEELPEAEQVEIITRIGKILTSQILERVLPELTDEKLDELTLLLEDENEDYHFFLFDWLEENIDGLEKIAQEELEKIKKQINE